MGGVVVCGGGVVGLAAAMMLARDGHDVTVLERDPSPPPESPAEAWEGWSRRGVAQFRQPHNLLPPVRLTLEAELPGTVERLLDAGCSWMDFLGLMPPTITDREPRPGDDRFRAVTGRRPVVEAALARAAEEEPGVTVRRGVAVAALVEGPAAIPGVPHVRGVRTSDGDELAADLVVDATGRRSPLVDWLAAVGARAPQVEAEDCGFVYHTRYFTGPRVPAYIAAPVTEMGTFSVLTIPGDNSTWSVTLWAAASDTALRPLRDPERFARVVAACPLQAHWLDGEPITEVLTMAGVLDRYRRFVVDGRPVATGVAAVGDSWACTNPSAGRGITAGLLHARHLRAVVAGNLDDPAGLARAWDEVTEAEVAPLYWGQIHADRARFAEMDALREGREPPAPDPERAALFGALLHDADVFRGALEFFTGLATLDEVLARPDIAGKVAAVSGRPGFPRLGPDRARLLELLA